jgi:hypothetical protein
MTSEVAALAGPLCSAELARAEAGEHGEEVRRLVEHLRDAGPSEVGDLKTELALDSKTLADVRRRLERVGAVVSRPIVLEPHAHTSTLERWDQRFAPSAGGIDDLLVAFVHAAVVAPERELPTWLSWPLPPGTVERLVDEGRLTRGPAGVSYATARRTSASVRP